MTSPAAAEPDVELEFMTREETWQEFEEDARKYFNMSADEFIAAWKAGRWPDPDGNDTDRNVMRVAGHLHTFAPELSPW